MIRWTHISSGDYEGVGDHAEYKVHRLSHKEVGVGTVNVGSTRGKWLVARKLGMNPFKIVAGAFDTAAAGKAAAERMEAAL